MRWNSQRGMQDQQETATTTNTTATTATTQNQDPKFEEIFKNPRNENQRVVVPFFIDGQQRGQVLLTLGNIPAVRIQAAPLLAETEKVIRPDTQAKLTSAVDTQGNLSLEVLLENGLQVTFDRSKLELQIQVTPAQRRTNVAQLNTGRLPPDIEKAVLPSTFSGYVNFRADKDYIWSSPGRYEIRLFTDPPAMIPFAIPPDAKGIYDIGTFKIPSFF